MLQTEARIAPRMTAGLRQAISLLALSGADLAARLAVEAAANPALQLMPPQGTGVPRPVFDPDGTAAPPDSLIAHVLHQVAHLRLAPRERAMALVLVEGLEPTGWLGTTLPAAARICGATEAEVGAILARLQAIEPGGLFARSLAECLLLQAKASGEATPAMCAVLQNLPLLAGGDLAALAAAAGHPLAEVAQAVARLRAYDPKPGLAFGYVAPAPPPPDLVLLRHAAGWEAAVNPAAPVVSVRAGTGDPAAATAIRLAVARRQQVALSVATLLARRQAGWLDGGDLLALTTAEVAQETGLHVATVNRILAAVTLRTPRGTLPLRAFIARPLGKSGPAAALVRRRLAELLANPGAAGLSDRALAALLAAEGLAVARRTVAKYRGELRSGGGTGPGR